MENKRPQMVIIIAGIIVLILLAIILTVELYNIKNSKNETPTINENNVIENEMNSNIINETIQNNTVVENSINEIVENTTTENNVIENTNSSDSNQQSGKEEIDNETMKKEENNREKAIGIVKEDWGEDDKVQFEFDSIDNNGNYVVCVRDRQTRNALFWYTVNIEKETFSIE